MNIIQNIVNMYKTDPINFLLIIAVVYLLLKRFNVIENFKLSDVEGEINLTDLSTVSDLAQKWENAFEIDNEGNITFKKEVNIIAKCKVIFNGHVWVLRRVTESAIISYELISIS